MAVETADTGYVRQPQTRCPRCDALVSGDAAWCSLCYADLRIPSEAALTVNPARLVVPARKARRGPDAAPGEQPDSEAGSEADGSRSADAMFAALAAQSTDPLRGLSGRFGSPGARVGLGVAALVATTVLTLTVLTILGLLF